MRGSVGQWLMTAAMAAGAWCVSCSSSTQKGLPASNPSDAATEAGPSAMTACADFAQAVCDRLSTCTPFAVKEVFGDVQTCAQRSAIPCPRTLASNGTKMTPSDLEKCVQVIKGQSCDQALDNTQAPECSIPGTLAAGAACGSDWQCATGFCEIAAGKLCGACATRTSSGQRASDGGAACVVDDDCDAKLVCASDGTCVSPGALGATCSGTQPCLRTLTCIGGTCATPLAVGAACSAATDCNGSAGLYCDTGTKKCVQAGTAASGQACGIVNGTLVACTSSALCANIDMQGQGTCHEPAGDGAPCGTLAGIGCTPPAACIDDTGFRCEVPDPGSCH